MSSNMILTFDVDWVCDDLLQPLVSYLIKHDIKATFFATHPSPLMSKIKQNELFQIGFHPNFFPNSTHGKSEGEVFEYFKMHFNSTEVVRPHGLYQYGALLGRFVKEWGAKYDSTIFSPMQWSMKPYVHHTPEGPLTRAPFVFADDYLFADWTLALKKNKPCFDHPQVFMFHPIHWVMNSPTAAYYHEQKTKYPNLVNLPIEKLPTIKNDSTKGIQNLFDEILESHKGGFSFFNDLDNFI